MQRLAQCARRGGRGARSARRRSSESGRLTAPIEGPRLACPSGVRRARGFTLLELAITVAVIAIVASAGYAIVRNARRNASVGAAAYEATMRLQGLRARALSDGVDLDAVFLDAKDNDASGCGLLASVDCTQLIVLSGVQPATFKMSDLAAGTIAGASLVDRLTFGNGLRFARMADGKSPAAPFDTVTMFDPALTRSTAGRAWFALRFTARGEVRPVVYGETPPAGKAGYAFVLGNALSDTAAGERKGVLVGFPAGIVRSFPF